MIDTAFIPPYARHPNHYFNMTQAGLREVMQAFQIQDIGVRPYQNPSYEKVFFEVEKVRICAE